MRSKKTTTHPAIQFALKASFSLVALSALGLSLAQRAHAAPQPALGVNLQAPIQLNAAHLLSMKAGERVVIDFPKVGRQTVVFEHTTKGQDGLAYWHGSVAGAPQDRVYLKQLKSGLFTGAIRTGGRLVSFKQQPDTRLVAAAQAAPVSGRLYTLGAKLDKGVYALNDNLAAIASAAPGSEISLPLPNGETEVAIVTQSEVDADGMYQVSAVSRLGGMAYPTLITVGTDAVFGTVFTGSGEYQIVTRNGQTQLLDPQGAGLKSTKGDDHVAVAPEATPTTAAALVSSSVVKAVTAAATTAASTTVYKPLAAGTVDTTITLLMTYSSTFVTQWGSEAVARTRLSNLVQLANSAYANSGTGIAFKVVGWKQVAQADTTPQVALPALRAGTGAFAGIPALRTSTGAAIVTFYAPYNATTGSTGTCGLAYVPAAGSQGLTAYKSQASSLMYASLNDGQTTSSYCSTLSFPHELGHNLGALHDKANSSTTGVFSYSYGKGVSGSFGTVMSYISPRVALFSSPYLTCTTGKAACGTATEDVVATFLQTKSTVAALGKPANASQATTGTTVAAGFLRTSTGAVFSGAATMTSSTAGVTCTVGSTGLYVCKVPSATTSITVTPKVTGKTITPTTGTFTVNALALTPVTGTTFYVK
ncbi:reprolysin-like metallopeptidase [Aquabacterium sp.]|uniref:reprolysin-like metallopeptidase n=1 Tax=Aquabacterium sp. TaxID=1872578 RepID=UPI0025C57379|nr:M12 family metallo-peptidase [Aquabacterium sp.]